MADHEGWQERSYPPTRYNFFSTKYNFPNSHFSFIPHPPTRNNLSWEKSEENNLILFRWVSTDYVDIFAHDGLEHMKAFQKLFLFITGANSESVEIPMTAPVTFRWKSVRWKINSPILLSIIIKKSLRIVPGEGPNCSSSVTMSFLVPGYLQVHNGL